MGKKTNIHNIILLQIKSLRIFLNLGVLGFVVLVRSGEQDSGGW